jgi:hypothetical protein
MRAWIVVAAAVAALSSLPAHADHGHHGGYGGPRVSFGYSFGYPYGYGFYRPYYSPWYWGPTFGVGVGVGVHSQRTRTEREERGEQKTLKLYIYPAAGQTQSQLADDRYQCHTWAADQSGYDPTLGAGDRDEAENYTRAFTACLEGRNYVVK